jgi:hypothetical protein
MRGLVRGVVVAVAAAMMTALPAGADILPPTGSQPVSEKDFAGLEARLDELEARGQESPDVEAVVGVVPQAVYDEFPGYAQLIRGGDPVPQFAQSGASIPPCVAQGSQLLSGFPPPYGYFAPASTNNFCLPNGPNGGCDIVAGSGLTFDFRAACRQHDLGYQWAPSTREAVDNRFLVDMQSDCARRTGWRAWQQPFCYGRAALRYAFVRAFGWVGYGNTERPGYNRPVPPTGVPPLVANTSCLQGSHGNVYYPPGGTSIPRGAIIYLSGVVRVNSRIRFEFRDSAGTLLATHLTYFAQENCVVEYESERFNTGLLPVGPVAVSATFPRWEASDEVTQQLGTYNITAGGGTTTCQQYTHPYVYTGTASSTFTRGAIIYPTGVVKRGTRVQFYFYDAGGALIATHLTAPARSNCVINHEPEAMSTVSFPLGAVSVVATYTEWETDQTVTRPVVTLNVVSGGGHGPEPCEPGLLPEPCP